ncbi:transcriptional pleiotropic repressor [Melissococcus plutonius]|nr:transcriptional pleiotropic repressor [Melissococcus plutonius]
MSTLIEKVRQINQLLQQKNMFSLNTDLPYDKMAISLGDILDSNAYIINNIGILLGYYEGLDVNNARIKTMFEEKKLPYEYTNATKQLNETTVNIPITSDLTAFPIEWRQKFLNGVTTIIPIYGTGERLGTIILSRMEKKFDDEDLILA